MDKLATKEAPEDRFLNLVWCKNNDSECPHGFFWFQIGIYTVYKE